MSFPEKNTNALSSIQSTLEVWCHHLIYCLLLTLIISRSILKFPLFGILLWTKQQVLFGICSFPTVSIHILATIKNSPFNFLKKAHRFKSIMQIRDQNGIRHSQVYLWVYLLQFTYIYNRILKGRIDYKLGCGQKGRLSLWHTMAKCVLNNTRHAPRSIAAAYLEEMIKLQ